jgi:DNA polymerase (family 10)
MAHERDRLAALFRELTELTILEEESSQSFRVRAYENAVQAIRNLPADFSEQSASALAKNRGIGKSTADKIREFIATGKIEKVEKLRVKFPPSVVELSRIPGVGPKTVAKLRKELGVQSIADLQKAIDAQKIRALAGFGQKTEEKLAEALKKALTSKKENRTPIAKAMPVATRLVAELAALPDVKSASYCGSLRRHSETIGDIDILVSSDAPEAVMSAFVKLPDVGDVIAHGEKKSSIRTKDGLQVDLRVVAPNQMGAALMYFTGSKAHNIAMRQRAIERGWTLNEYALSVEESGEVVASETEEAIYRALDLAHVPPPMREGNGEIEAAAEDALPKTVRVADLLGDFHVHTDRSGDAHSSIDEVVSEAVKRGYRYFAVTDHAEGLPMNGISRDEILAQRDEVAALRERYPDLHLMQGIELNIGPDGSLDYDPDFRMGLDFCVAAVHAHFNLPEAEQTKRILAAMDDPSVNVIGHLSGRMIGRRPGIDLDLDAVFQKAVDTGTAIEINAALPRLDCAADALRRARELDVTFIISTDAHHVAEYDRMEWGARQAQRGWVDRDKVANTWDLERFMAFVLAKRERVS